MVVTRPLDACDIDDLYAISLATGHVGGDARHLYDDPMLIGHIYSGPYAALCPDLCLIAEDDLGVGGFILGALDTSTFEDRLEREWWPTLRERYPDPDPAQRALWNADQRRSHRIHHPRRTPASIVGACPAHLHLNLLPRLQGHGLGRTLLKQWLALATAEGVRHVHVGSNADNHRAIRFWQARHFAPLTVESGEESDGTVWLGRSI